MYIDLTLKITPKIIKAAQIFEKKSLYGHLGTHFDVMAKEFPLEYIIRKGIVFDVSGIQNRDIGIQDIDLSMIDKNMFVAFFSGYIDKAPYGSENYFKYHPQLSDDLIDKMVEKQISIIGIDFAGLRRGAEHTPKDAYLAERDIFVLENVCNLKKILNGNLNEYFLAYTFPVNYSFMTGLPCRVVAKV